MLALDDPRWAELRHAYGSATDTPILLKSLEANPNQEAGDPLTSDDPWNLLWGSICHQGSVYSASYAAVPHLIRIASLAADPSPIEYLLLPAYIVRGRSAPMPPYLEESYTEAVARLPGLIPRMVGADLDGRNAPAITDALLMLCGHCELELGLTSMKLAGVKCYQQFYFDFQHLADVRVWKNFPDEETSLFMSTPGDA